jgi:glycosyltransferase involved in cell wall biosynthesis
MPPWKSSFFNPSRYFGVSKLNLCKYNIEVLIDTGHYATIGLFIVNRKFVVVHDITPTLHPKFHRIKSRLGHKLLLKRALSEADKIITVSDQTMSDVSEHYGFDSKLNRIYPGMRSFEKNDASKSTLHISKPYFLCVGTIEPRKNHAKLIRAFDLFCQVNRDYDLIIVGDRGWKVDLDQLISQSSNKDQIKRWGYVSATDLRQLYTHAASCVYVSLYEGFGFPVLEAMSMGCPVITSKVGSMNEIAKGAAKLVNPYSPEEISIAMYDLVTIEGERTRLINLGLERSAKFTWTDYIRQLDELLED